jgi:hypothetical protein
MIPENGEEWKMEDRKMIFPFIHGKRISKPVGHFKGFDQVNTAFSRLSLKRSG